MALGSAINFMSQKTYIIIATLVIVLLLAVWLYLIVFGTPKNPGDIFNPFGPQGQQDDGQVILPEPVAPPVVNIDRPRLRQLTTKPVIGFTEAPAATTSPILIYYAEAGNGNIYTLNPFTTEEERRLSNTTLKEASAASFSTDGKTVAVRLENDRRVGELSIGNLNEGVGYEFSSLEKPVSDFKVLNANELVFVTATSTGLLNTVYNLTTKQEKPLFTVPFFEARMEWGTSSRDSHYVFTKPTYLFEGYTYKFTKSKMSRVPVSGFGLIAFNTPTHIAYTKIENLIARSSLYNKLSDTKIESPIIIVPDKCTASQKDTNTIWCAVEGNTMPAEFPDNWYRGLISFKDTIWKVDLLTSQASPIVDTLAESGGRELDIINMMVGESERALYFINKNDNTLWMYEL